MGDETSQFATRFSHAVALLSRVARDDGFEQLRREHGAKLAHVVREALDAVEAVYGTGTSAVRDWPERSRAALASIAELRRLVDRGGVDAEVRRRSGTLVALIEDRSPRG